MKLINQFKNPFGFTLMELLVVVIIIALMSAISFGYYKKSVEHSRFSEGLQAASTVSEAVNRAYFDDQLEGKTPQARYPIKMLDINIANAALGCSGGVNTDYCLTTRYFEVAIGDDGVVYAYRGNPTSCTYYIEVKPRFATSATNVTMDTVSCVGCDEGGNGKTFCETQGYTKCEGNVCIKP